MASAVFLPHCTARGGLRKLFLPLFSRPMTSSVCHHLFGAHSCTSWRRACTSIIVVAPVLEWSLSVGSKGSASLRRARPPCEPPWEQRTASPGHASRSSWNLSPVKQTPTSTTEHESIDCHPPHEERIRSLAPPRSNKDCTSECKQL